MITVTSRESALYWVRFRKMTSLVTPPRNGIFNKVASCQPATKLNIALLR